MVLCRMGQPIEALRGSVGAVTFRTRVRTALAGTRTGNRKPRTEAQRATARMAQQTAALWRAMSSAQREAWEEFAKFLVTIPDPLVEGKHSGFGVWTGHARRWLLTGTTPPLAPAFPGGQIPDPPWLKFYPTNTTGTFRVWADPTGTMPAPGNQRFLLYAGPPRPNARRAYRRDERYRQFWTDATLPGLSPAVTVNLGAGFTTRPGSNFNVRAVTISDVGYTSRTYGWTLTTLGTGRAVAFVAWVYQILSTDAGIELDPSGFLRVWSFDYPTGAPDVLDLNAGGTKTVGDIRAFIAARYPFDTLTVSAGLLARPWTQLLPIPSRHATAKDAAIVFDTNT